MEADLYYFYLLYPVSDSADRFTPIASLGELAAQIADDPIFGKADLASIIAVENEMTQQQGRPTALVDECLDLLGPIQKIYDQLIPIYGDVPVRTKLIAFLNGTIRLALGAASPGPGSKESRRTLLKGALQDTTAPREIFYYLVKSSTPGWQIEQLLQNLLDASIDHALSPMQAFVIAPPAKAKS